MNKKQYLNGRVVVKTGDITAENTDAIVNAANKTLLGGGGVDGAIHRHGGPQILAECRLIRKKQYPDGLPTGCAVITGAGFLSASWVIHTVGPIFDLENGKEAELLAACYKNCLLLADSKQLKSISFPSISTGAFGYPKHEAASIASRSIIETISALVSVEFINLVFYSDADAAKFVKHSSF